MRNYYEILDLTEDASEEEIREELEEAKQQQAHEPHFPKTGQLFSEIERTLLDSEKRQEYDEQLANASEADPEVDTSAIETEELVSEGWKMLSVGNVAAALMIAKEATNRQDENPDAWALLGYCKFTWEEFEDAIPDFKRATELRPNEASFYFWV